MQLIVSADMTALSYWLNWRFLLCAIWVLTPTILALFVIGKYEGQNHRKSEQGKAQQEAINALHIDEAWRPCLRGIHPIWLLAFRVISFCWLFASLVDKVLISAPSIFFYYTQWTFTLVTIYFGLGALLSIYGCFQYHKISSRDLNEHHVSIDAEQGYYTPLTCQERTDVPEVRKDEEIHVSQAIRTSSYVFQVIFQTSAGAVMLTDCIYWSIIYPFLTIKDYDLSFMTVNMHTLNAVLILGDTVLNCLPFPWFRFAYFVLWTSAFTIFQWILHACVSIRWPYPFLDLSSPYAPLWYLVTALLHIPCYGLFALIVRTKHYLLWKWFPPSNHW
ncbi:uncharacterized protein LOC120010053 isoform X2 [Tripterygium wilfordii]|nr:uncharacterized protein LOC120010053 isoform X2 [Tripterygium wilfordii]